MRRRTITGCLWAPSGLLRIASAVQAIGVSAMAETCASAGSGTATCVVAVPPLRYL